jgi:hypothetical protein
MKKERLLGESSGVLLFREAEVLRLKKGKGFYT